MVKRRGVNINRKKFQSPQEFLFFVCFFCVIFFLFCLFRLCGLKLYEFGVECVGVVLLFEVRMKGGGII